MARCGCNNSCSCLNADSGTIEWSGYGSQTEPFQAEVVADPNSPLEVTTSGNGVSVSGPVVSNTSCIEIEGDGSVGTPLQANLILDPVGGLTCGEGGLSVGYSPGSIEASNINWDSGIWWEELGRHTLNNSDDVLAVVDFEPRNYLKLFISGITTGGSGTLVMTFNGDSGANYARRISTTFGAGSTTGNDTSIRLEASGIGTGGSFFGEYYIQNYQPYAKILKGSVVFNTSGAASASAPPFIADISSHWVNTSEQITTVTIANGGTGDYEAGTELIILGHN